MRLAYLFLGTVLVSTGCGASVSPGPNNEAGAGGSTTSSSSSSSGAGMGGNGGMGQGGGHVASPECTQDSECVVINDCCNCAGAPVNGPFPDCPITECFAPTCDVSGLGGVKPLCVAGRCVVDADCNHDHVQCNTPPPTCAPGQTPHVVNGCWGGCVSPNECREVGSCTQCLDGQACVDYVAFTTERHCVDIPAVCNGQTTCGCVGASSCVSPYPFCVEQSSTELRCECINC